MANKFFDEPFDEATKLKLEIFGECFKEWLPVFIHNKAISKIFIYDFFAGTGFDIEGYPGSPIILLKEAKGDNCKVCNSLNGKEVCFAFNDKHKSQQLKASVTEYLNNCSFDHCKNDKCKYSVHFGDYEFKEAFARENVKKILNNSHYAKFILLDQFGFKQIEESVFLELSNSPRTDFIFFIASSFIDRFKEHPNVKKYIDTSKINFDEVSPKERHRLIANYFEQLVYDREFYVHHFTIKKGGNYYGLIFGSGHTYGMEKFLKVCWQKDIYSGESMENVYNDFEPDTLFHDIEKSNKKEAVKKLIIEKVLSGEIHDNISGLKFALKNRCMPELFTKTIRELEGKKIKRVGEVNNQNTRIHDVKKYSIELL